MNKKNQPGDENLQRAWSNYRLGNFFLARAWAKKVLASSTSLEPSREQAASVMTMTGADPLALLAGVLVLVFSVVIAYIVAY